MDNVCRKAIRLIICQLIEIRDFMKVHPKATGYEIHMLDLALKYLVTARDDDFKTGRRSKYVEPKGNFKFKKL